MLQLQVSGLHLDIQYARSARLEHPAVWPSATCDDGGQAVAGLKDLHALRTLVFGACGIQGWRRLQAALILVKAWARARGVHSNASGYLGGWAWTLLLADTLLTGSAAGADDGCGLAAAMWQRFAEWPWPRPVVLNSAHGSGQTPACSGALMPILCPSDPTANSARNVTA